MIKLIVEIKDGEFHYNVSIGEDRHSSSFPLSMDAFVAFNDLLRTVSSADKWRKKEFEQDLWGKVYLERLEKDKK